MPRIVSYNVRHCRGSDGIISPARIAKVIADLRPDIVALQELDVGRARSNSVDQAMAIAGELEMSFHFHPAMTVMEERYGDAILTALPSRLVKAGPLPTVPGLLGVEPRGALWASVEVENLQLQVLNTHLGLFPAERAVQTMALIGPEWLGHPDCSGPVVMVGDLNALPWGRSYPRLARAIAGPGGFSRTNPTPATFPSRFPFLAIDHIIANPWVEIEAVIVGKSPLARIASDHLPLVADLSIAASKPDIVG